MTRLTFKWKFLAKDQIGSINIHEIKSEAGMNYSDSMEEQKGPW